MRIRLAVLVLSAAALALACGAPGGAPPSAGVDAASSSSGAGTGSTAASPSGGAADTQTAPATPAPLRKLRLALGFLGAEAMPVFVGLDQGIYRKYGVDVEPMVLQSSAQIAPSMASGEIDIGLSAGSGTVDIDLAGGDQVLVLNHSNILHFQLVGRPEIKRVEDLAGKRIAISRLGSSAHFSVQIILERAGFDPMRDVIWAQLGTSEAGLVGLTSGAVDALITGPPQTLLAIREGYPLIADTKTYNVSYTQAAMAVTRPTLAARYDLIRDFLRGHVEAVGLTKRDRALATRLLGERNGIDDQEILDFTYDDFVGVVDGTLVPTVESVQTVLEQRAPEIPAARTANPRDFIDDRIMRGLVASGFVEQMLGPPTR
jgi:ABC-type nitrate/sulfonate/bicarbonate transport system substrate-binding protein